MPDPPIVVALTGGSGAAYAVRLIETLVGAGRTVHVTISSSARLVLEQELGVAVELGRFRVEDLLPTSENTGSDDPALRRMLVRMARQRPVLEGGGQRPRGMVVYHHYEDYLAPIASGSFLTAGMVICPCSGSTLSAVVHGAANNLIHRAADVHLKEGRKLILVPRETPLGLVQVENLQRACRAGAIVLPASPGWYHGVESLDDLVDFIVARVLDQLAVPHQLMRRWGC